MNLFFVVVGALIIGAGWLFHLRAQAKGKRAQAWPTTQGLVTSSSVSPVSVGQSTMLAPTVVYAYEVAGAALQGAGYRLGAPPMFNTPSKADAAAAKYPEGSRVTVHYDPANPANAALELKVGEGFGPLMLYSFGATLFGLGLVGVLLGFKG